MAQNKSDAIKYPFVGLYIILCGDLLFTYDQSINAVWNTINWVMILNIKNQLFTNILRSSFRKNAS
jgi:hypothetical protein